MEIILTAILVLTVNILSLIVYRVIIVRRRHRGADARDRLRELAAMDHLGPDPQSPELHVVRSCDAVVTVPCAATWTRVRGTTAALGLVGVAAVFVLSSSGVGAPDVAQLPLALLPPALLPPDPAVDTSPPTKTADAAPASTTQLATTPTPHAGEPVKLQTAPRSSRPGKPPTVPTSDSQPPSPRQEPLSSSSTPTPSRQPLCAGTIQVQSVPLGCSIG